MASHSTRTQDLLLISQGFTSHC